MDAPRVFLNSPKWWAVVSVTRTKSQCEDPSSDWADWPQNVMHGDLPADRLLWRQPVQVSWKQGCLPEIVLA